MKKKSIVIGIIVLVAIIGLSIWFLNSRKALGSMRGDYSTPETRTSSVGFKGEAGETIKFSFKSDIKSGDLAIVLYDSDGNAVYELDKENVSETYFTLKKSDTYTLEAEYKEFVGNYKISIDKKE